MEAIKELLSLLEAGQQPSAGLVQRVLRRPGTPSETLAQLAECSWLLRDRRLVSLLAGHPHCPRHLAVQLLLHLGWNELLQLARSPRTPVPVRRQAERRLVDRFPTLTVGERVNLARRATRTLALAILGENDVRIVRALLDSAQCVESVPVRILANHPPSEIVTAIVSHDRWGRLPVVRVAAIRSRHTAPAVSLGLLATLSEENVANLLDSGGLSPLLKLAAEQLLAGRPRSRAERSRRPGKAPPLAPGRVPPTLDSQ